MTEQLVVRNARLAYGERVVLRGLDLAVGRGEILAIVGRSGCGKTTLLRSACALLPLDAGEVVYDGEKIVQDKHVLFDQWDIRRKLMYVAQTPTLLPHMTALRNVTLGLELVRGLSRTAAASLVREAAGEMELSGRLNSYPEELSGGEAQRVQLLRAMVLQPEVLLLDEVTANIDPETTCDVVAALWLLRKHTQTVVMVTHIIEFAERFADRIAFMHDGVIYEEGAARSFREAAVRDATRQFLESTRLPLDGSRAGDGDGRHS